MRLDEKGKGMADAVCVSPSSIYDLLQSMIVAFILELAALPRPSAVPRATGRHRRRSQNDGPQRHQQPQMRMREDIGP